MSHFGLSREAMLPVIRSIYKCTHFAHLSTCFGHKSIDFISNSR